MPFEGFQTKPRCLMRSGAEREPCVDHDPDSSRRRGIVAPFGTNEDALPDLHRLQILVGERNPIARVGWLDLAAESRLQLGLAGVIIEKHPQARAFLKFHDPRASRFPKLGDREIAIRLRTFNVD